MASRPFVRFTLVTTVINTSKCCEALRASTRCGLSRAFVCQLQQQKTRQVIANHPCLPRLPRATEAKILLKAVTPSANLMALAAAQELAPGIAREVNFNLNIEYHNGWIRNPGPADGTGRYDKVQLRSYVQGDGRDAKSKEPSTTWGAEQSTAYVAPEIEAYPGQTVRIALNNDLPPDPTCVAQGGSANTRTCFNGTNLHSHGLWISPSGNSVTM